MLALDVGEKRVGVALCDETQTLARPLLTLHRASKKEDFARLAALCREHAIEKVIVGLPKTLRGEEGPQGRAHDARASAAVHGCTVSRPRRRREAQEHPAAHDARRGTAAGA